jgi:hypothetical protein
MQCRPHQTLSGLPPQLLNRFAAAACFLSCPSAAFSSKAGTQRISRGAESGTQSSAPASPFDFFKKKEGTQVVKGGGRVDAGTGAVWGALGRFRRSHGPAAVQLPAD